eukprot:CFRG7525T1
MKIALIAGAANGEPARTECSSLELKIDTKSDKSAWIQADNLPELKMKRSLHCASKIGNSIITCGGYKAFPENMLDSAEMLHLDSHTWVDIASLPEPRCGAAAGILNDRFICVSGYGFKDSMQYDPVKDSWLKLVTMDVERYRLSVECTGTSALYAMGGWCNEFGSLNTACRLDTRTGSWTKVASMTTKKHGFASAYCCHSNSIYTIGGHLGDGSVTDFVERYDIRADKWEVLKPMPVGRMGSAAVAVYNAKKSSMSVHVIGGQSKSKEIGLEYFTFSTATGEWEVHDPIQKMMPTKCAQAVILSQ